MLYVLINLLLLSVISPSQGQKNVLSNSSSICSVYGCHCINASVTCNFSMEDFNIDGNSMPSSLQTFKITGGRHIKFKDRSFSKIQTLNDISIENVTALTLEQFSFLRTHQELELKILNIDVVEIESKSFYTPGGPVKLIIKNCSRLRVHSQAVSRIVNLTISDVSDFELGENAFQTSEKKTGQKNTTKIMMTRVSMNELPKNSFLLWNTEIKLLDCNIKTIRRKAFSSLSFENVKIENCNFTSVESEAFSEGSVLNIFELKNVRITNMYSGAISCAVGNFSISDTTIDTIEKEAFNMSAMVEVLFINNTFKTIREKGITLKDWTKSVFVNNTLSDLDHRAINILLYNEQLRQPAEFLFVGNILNNIKEQSLNLNIGQKTDFTGNILLQPCQCDLRAHLKKYILASDHVIDSMYNNSYCSVISSIAKCFNHLERFMKIPNFVDKICHIQDAVSCTKQNETSVEENSNIVKANDILNEQKRHRERLVINAVIQIAIIAVIIMAVLSMCMWFSRKGYLRCECFAPSLSHVLLSMFSRLTISNEIIRTASSNSIARVPPHEYAEVLPQKLLNIEVEGMYECEDKATQTLPEELTQELLQSLREKLDDPENYKEARNMIEHLYDLIKVEECCNNNELDNEYSETNASNFNSEGCTNDENLYDVIKTDTKQKVRRYDRSFKTLANKGTRAPSPDKLLPQSYAASSFSSSLQKQRMAKEVANTLVTEYMEPSDQRSHIYSELLYDRNDLPDKIRPYSGITILSDYKDPHDVNIPIYSELVELINRPLPVLPTVIQVNNDLGDTTGTRT